MEKHTLKVEIVPEATGSYYSFTVYRWADAASEPTIEVKSSLGITNASKKGSKVMFASMVNSLMAEYSIRPEDARWEGGALLLEYSRKVV